MRVPEQGDRGQAGFREGRRADFAVFLLGPLAGISGGDVHAFRLVDRIVSRCTENVVLLAPGGLDEHLPGGARRALTPVRTSLDSHAGGMAVYFANLLLRMTVALTRAPPSRVDIATSHQFQDVIPCVVRRVVRRNSVVAAYAYHLVQEERVVAKLRSRVSISLERLSVSLLRACRAVMFVDNHATRVALEARGVRPRDIIMTSNAYNPWLPLPARSPAPEPTAVCCGRMTEEKGVWDAIELASSLADRLPAARVVMLGDGPLRARVEEFVAERGLTNVDLPGFVPEGEKWQQLRSGHVFVAPSREEGWGIAVGEALTAGLPVVAYDLPAYWHFGDTLIRVPVGDIEGLVDAVSKTLASPTDPVPWNGALRQWNDVLDREIEHLDARLRRGQQTASRND